jgi:transcriptional regulator with XRE-family HTH domain
MNDNGFSKRLKELRLQKNLSQSDLGRMVGVHYVHIGKYERGLSLPNSGTLKKLAEALGVTTDYLFEGESNDVATAKIEDRELLQMFKEIQNLQEDDKTVIKKLIEAFLTKKKVFELTKP